MVVRVSAVNFGPRIIRVASKLGLRLVQVVEVVRTEDLIFEQLSTPFVGGAGAMTGAGADAVVFAGDEIKIPLEDSEHLCSGGDVASEDTNPEGPVKDLLWKVPRLKVADRQVQGALGPPKSEGRDATRKWFLPPPWTSSGRPLQSYLIWLRAFFDHINYQKSS